MALNVQRRPPAPYESPTFLRWLDKLADYLNASFESTAQTITAAGALTIAHGLPAKPSRIACVLTCTTGENGYTAGDEVWFPAVGQSTSADDQSGLIVVPDATNLNIRFGSYAATTINVLDKSTGAGVRLTNTNWTVTFRAWL